MAPFTPFYAEDLYMKLTKGKKLASVHLESWPTALGVDVEVISKMEAVRKIVESALADRSKKGIKVRQPISKVIVTNYETTFDAYPQAAELIKDEVNAKAVEWIVDASNAELKNSVQIDENLTPELIEEGKFREFTRAIQDLRKTEGLEPSDAIWLLVSSDEKGKAFVGAFEKEISKAVLATKITTGPVGDDAQNIKIEDLEFNVVISRQS
jgi:isoleucyl-tRNA synthetase